MSIHSTGDMIYGYRQKQINKQGEDSNANRRDFISLQESSNANHDHAKWDGNKHGTPRYTNQITTPQ